MKKNKLHRVNNSSALLPSKQGKYPNFDEILPVNFTRVNVDLSHLIHSCMLAKSGIFVRENEKSPSCTKLHITNYNKLYWKDYELKGLIIKFKTFLYLGIFVKCNIYTKEHFYSANYTCFE